MTEREYIAVSDLAKIRVCLTILRDTQPGDKGQLRPGVRTAIDALYKEMESLQRECDKALGDEE